MKKYYYYVGVLNQSIHDDDLQYVYGFSEDGKQALYATYSWLRENGKKPLEFKKKESAINISRGLCLNFCLSIVITSFVEFR